VASIERTAYPRFRHEPNARELQDLFTPTQDEIGFARSLVRDSNEHFFAAVLLLKCLQYLGYFPELSAIPTAIVNHVRICLRLSPASAWRRSRSSPVTNHWRPHADIASHHSGNCRRPWNWSAKKSSEPYVSMSVFAGIYLCTTPLCHGCGSSTP
jgi:hypothetical protein